MITELKVVLTVLKKNDSLVNTPTHNLRVYTMCAAACPSNRRYMTYI